MVDTLDGKTTIRPSRKQFLMIPYSDDAPCFDDILLVPQYGNVSSRHEVGLDMTIGIHKGRVVILSLPVIAAPMDTVCDVEMCMAIGDAGGLGILHRYMSEKDMINKTQTLSSYQKTKKNFVFGVAIGSSCHIDYLKSLYDCGARIFLVDTANGHSEQAISSVARIRKLYDDVHIMAGNVATAEGFSRLAEAGADSVRVGIGGGSACTTRIVSGHGVPTLASIIDIKDWASSREIECTIIADGGIRNSGDMVKAFAAGAGAVMVGSMLAGTDEAPGKILKDVNGKEVKAFRGMASADAQQDAKGRVSVAEGISTTVSYKGSVGHILDQIRGGLGSGCSYSGVKLLSELNSQAEYVKVSALSINESKPHAI